MQWQAVDSSQIAEIGYEIGARYPLGVRFPPNKKQIAAGEPGGEYHYENVSPELHALLLAAKDNPAYNNSIGVFFGRIIKNRPDLYQFVKVEAENPPQPPSDRQNGGDTNKSCDPPMKNTSTKSASDSMIDAEPSTALAVIDAMDDDLLFTPGGVTDAQLAAGRNWYLAEAKKYDISTEKARTELKRFARPLQKLRTGIEARAKELTGATKRKIAAIDAEKRRLVQAVGGIEDEVLAPLTAWEQEEETRKANLAVIVKGLGEFSNPSSCPSIASLEEAIVFLESFDTSTMQEYKVGAESAIAASLRVLKPELERRKVAEANEKELAELRRKQAERDEADRIAAAAEALLAKRSIFPAMPPQVDLPSLEGSRMVGNTIFLREEAAEAADHGEPEDSPELAQATPPAPFWESTVEQKQFIHAEVIESLVGYDCSTRQGRIQIVEAIIAGRIPHLSINY